MTITTQVQVTFALNNPGADDTLYISADPMDNQVTFTLTVSDAVTLDPADLVPINQAGSATGSLIYLDLTALDLDPNLLQTFGLKAKGWKSQAFPNDNMIALSPAKSVSLKADQTLSFELANFALPASPGSSAVTLALDIFHVQGIAVGAYPAMYQTNVALANPPTAKQDLHDAMSFTITPNTVLTNNSTGDDLQLILSLKDDQQTVNAGSDTVFNLYVVYATDPNGHGALMTAAEGSAITIPTPAGTQWSITNVPGTAGRYWQMKPPANQPLPGPNGTAVAFDFSPVVSTFQPGPTTVLLTYSNVPGYKDGTFTFTLLKQPKATIDSFTVTPSLSALSNGEASVTLNWTTTNATSLLLYPGPIDVTGRTSLPQMITATTHYTLIAYGPGGSGANNRAISNTTATVVPVLDQLEALPSAISIDDFGIDGVPLTLRWAVNAGSGTAFQLDSSIGGTIGSNFGALESYAMSVNQPQMFTLSITNDQTPENEWKAYVPAFQLQSQTPAPAIAGTSPVAALGASYVATCTSAGQVSILSTASYQAIATVSVGGQPSAIVFAPDGGSFYVADKAGGSIRTVDVVTIGGQTPPWSFTAGANFSVGGAPVQLAYGAGNVLYAAVGNDSSPGWLAAVDLKTQAVSKVTVGIGTAAVAVSPSGAQIFVSNTADGAVSQIGRAINGTYQLIQTLTGLPGAAGIAVTPDGKSLLVCCSDGTLRVMDATAPDTTQAKSIALGGTPVALALDGAGAYAFVLDAANSRVSVVSLAKAAVIGTPKTVAAGATDVSVSPDGTIVLVGGAALSIFALQTYLGRSYSADCKGLVTDVTVTPDGKRVFTWANAAVQHSHQKPAQGLQVYDTASQTITPFFIDRAIVGVTVPRQSTFSIGMMSILGQSGLYPLDCGSLQIQNPIVVPPKTDGTSRQPLSLASSVDGQTVFAVVANGQNSYSLVVLTGGGESAFQIAADVSLFTTRYVPLSIPVVAAPDGSFAYVYDSTAGNVWVVTGDGAGNFSLGATPLSAPGSLPLGFVISPDGDKVYLATQRSMSTAFYVIETAKQTIAPFPLSESIAVIFIQSMAMSPDGSRIFVTDATYGSVRAIDALSLRFQQTISWPTSLSGPVGIAVTGDQSGLYVATTSGRLASATQVRLAPVQRRRLALAAPRLLVAGVGDSSNQNGAFIRHQMGDSPHNNGGTFSACPDIVISVDSNNNPVPLDPTTLVTPTGYMTDPNPGSAVSQGNVNYVYLRALNNTAAFQPPPQLDPRLWLAYTPSNLALWPAKWMTQNIQVQGQAGSQNWQDSSNIIYGTGAGSNYMVTKEPFLWNPNVLTDGNHYCLISMSENPLEDPPWMPNPGAFSTFDDLIRFVLTNDWFGWRNTRAVQKTVPTWQLNFPLAGPPEKSGVDVGVKCSNMPVGSTFSFSVAGPDGTTTTGVTTGPNPVPISDPNQGFYLPMTFPSGFNTTMVLNWYANGKTPDTGAKIIGYLGRTDAKVQLLLYGKRSLREPFKAYALDNGHWTMIHPFGSISVVFQ